LVVSSYLKIVIYQANLDLKVLVSSEFQTHIAMDAINNLLNIALPPLSLIFLSILMLPWLIFKQLVHVRKSLNKENVASKVVLITGAASGIGEVCLIHFFFYPC